MTMVTRHRRVTVAIMEEGPGHGIACCTQDRKCRLYGFESIENKGDKTTYSGVEVEEMENAGFKELNLLPWSEDYRELARLFAEVEIDEMRAFCEAVLDSIKDFKSHYFNGEWSGDNGE